MRPDLDADLAREATRFEALKVRQQLAIIAITTITITVASVPSTSITFHSRPISSAAGPPESSADCCATATG